MKIHSGVGTEEAVVALAATLLTGLLLYVAEQSLDGTCRSPPPHPPDSLMSPLSDTNHNPSSQFWGWAKKTSCMAGLEPGAS